jgi:hypothetical protein
MSGASACGFVLGVLLVLAVCLRSIVPPLIPLENHRPTDTSLGLANEGAHSLHVAGAAVVDIVLTFAAATVFAVVSRAPVTVWLVVLLVAGETMHWAYGIPTATYVWLFGTPS